MVVSHSDGEGSLDRNLVLENGSILMGNEFPLAIHFPREAKCLVAELVDAMFKCQFVIVNAREILAVQLPSVDELTSLGNLNLRGLRGI